MDQEKLMQEVLAPVSRIRAAKGRGSGTIIHSSAEGTYLLTNFHVVEDNISYKEVWDELLRRDVKKEFTSQVEVDTYKFGEKGDVQGIFTTNADIILGNKQQDLALLKLRTEVTFSTAKLYPEDKAEQVPLLSELTCAGAAMGEKPIVTTGLLNGIQIEIDNYEYWLSSAPSIFGNCLPGDTLVSMADGTVKEIKDLQVGELVLAYGPSGLNKQTRVDELIHSGVKRIYEVKTRNRTLRASGNHPVVQIVPVKDWTGRIRNIPVWQRVDSLQPGDIIAVMSSHVTRELGRGFNFAKEIGQDKNPEMLMRLLGFFVGDGYKRRRPSEGGELNLYPYDEELGKLYEKILKDLFDVRVTVIGRYEQLRVSSTGLVDKLSVWGFDGSSRTKTIPDWVMTQIAPYQMAFLQGYAEADGYVNKYNAWVFEAANEKLIKQLRMMAIHLGLQVSNIHYRQRTTTFPNGNSGDGETWTFQVYRFYGKSPNSYFEGDKQLLPDDLQYVKVNDVKVVGEAETYDIKLSPCHSFFADGVLVHNSGGAVFTRWDGAWHYLGIPSRIRVAILGFAADAITHMGYFIPISRIYHWLRDNCYEYLWCPEVSKEDCDRRREEMRKEQLALAAIREKG